MFSFIKNALSKIYTQVTSKLGSLFGRATIDEATLKELEILLISSDTGVQTTKAIMGQLRTQVLNGTITQGNDLRKALEQILKAILEKTAHAKNQAPTIHFLVGINGSGKTTFAGKLASLYTRQGKKVLLVAADTFRAAAPEQLSVWSERTGAAIVLGTEGQDPASVVFKGCEQFLSGNYDILIIDTAGRLQVKKHLMAELQKMKNVVTKKLPNYSTTTILTVDAMLGQNSFEQAKLFKESTDVNCIALTKMDGTGKGGIVFSISDQLAIPIGYISFGEQLDQCKPFDASEYVHELLYK
jgi:fused signal recognition particle receptor